MKLFIGCFILLAAAVSSFSEPFGQTNKISAAASRADFSETNRLTVALLGFENKTGNPSNDCWRIAAQQLLDKALSNVKTIRSLSGIRYALKKINKKDGDSINQVEARKIGELIEARRVIWGDYQRQGTNWLVRVRVLNVATDKVKELNAASADWFELRDKLSEQIFKQLEISPSAAEWQKIQRRLTSSVTTLEYLSKATLLYMEGKPYVQTEELARKALAADPKCAEAYELLGAALGNQGKLEDGEKNVRQSLALRPESAHAHYTLGHILGLQEKNGEAEDELLEAIRLDPDDADSVQLLGQLYGSQDKNMLAIAAYKKAIRLDPLTAEYHADLGYALAQQGERELAVPELKLAAQLALKDDLNTEQFLAIAYKTLNEVPSAIEHYGLFVKLAKAQGLNPEMVESFEKTLSKLKSSLTPVYVEAQVPKEYTPAELAKTMREKLTEAEFLLVTNPLAGSPEMDHWANKMTTGATNDFQKARMLFDKLTRHINRESGKSSRTARDMFAAWDKPDQTFVCKEYANFYVALARAVGLKAFFVYVSEEYDGAQALHACAGVFIAGKLMLVDPMYCWFGVPHKRFMPLDDLQTVGMYLSQNPPSPMVAGMACKLAPGLPVAHYNLFFSLTTAEKWRAASEALTNALTIDPDSALAKAARGVWALHENKPELAVSFLQKSTEMDPAQGDIFAMLALAYAQLEKPREERDSLRKALRCGLSDDDAEQARQEIAKINEAIGYD